VDHDSLSIYIGNVDYSATEEELRDAFLECGDIVRVTIIKNMKTGHPKGAAFIEFTKKDGVNAAMDMNGKEVKGKFIQLRKFFIFLLFFFWAIRSDLILLSIC